MPGGVSSTGLRLVPEVTLLLSLQLEKNLAMSKHTLEYGMKARQFDSSDFQDQSVTRILKKLSVIERAALPEDELKEVSGKRGCPLPSSCGKTQVSLKI